MVSGVLAFGTLRPGSIVSKKFLYRRWGSFVIGLVIFLAPMAVLPSLAQGRRPPRTTPETNSSPEKKKAKGKEPRAVAILQFDSKGGATLVPVAILIDGKFYDAGAYKADPVPMALESGTVYEAEQSGDSQGLFTIGGALHSKSPVSEHPWVARGTYLPHGAEAPKTKHKAEDVPVGIDSKGDEPPRLTRKDTAKPAATTDSSGSSTASGSGSQDKAGVQAPAAPKAGSGSSTSSSSGQEAPKPVSSPAPDKPGDATAKQPTQGGEASQGQPNASQTPVAQAPGSAAAGETSKDYYRPALRRGKPTAPAPSDGDDVPAKIAGKNESVPAAASGNSAPARMMAAISDAAGPDPQSYNFFWKTGEEDERRKQMLALAANEVRAYATALVKNQILAHPVTPKAGASGRRAPAKQAVPVFENVQFRGYDVWLNNQPVLILSAEAHIQGATGVLASAEPYSVMLVARTDIYGNLRKLYSGVTDKFHLDVTPRMELIDVVDADGDGRGELLFHETSDAGSGYVIYRATADKLWKMFDSLSEE